MPRIRFVQFVSFVACLCALLGSVERAHACSPPAPSCTAPVRLFPLYPEAPSNLIRFRVEVEEPGELTLRTLDGTPVAASIKTMAGDRVFSPDVDPEPDQDLELVYTTVCPKGSSMTPTEEVYTFLAYAPAPLELRDPELSVTELGFAFPDNPDQKMRFVRVQHYSPDAQGTSTHLMDHFITVDGEPYPMGTEDGRAQAELRSRCADPTPQIDSCGHPYSLAAGEHTIESWSTIVGEAGEPLRVTLTVDLSCDRECGTTDGEPGQAEDAGVTDDGQEAHEPGGQMDDGMNDAKDDSAMNADTGAGGGCAVTRSGHAQGSDTALWLAGLLALLSRRRCSLCAGAAAR